MKEREYDFLPRRRGSANESRTSCGIDLNTLAERAMKGCMRYGRLVAPRSLRPGHLDPAWLRTGIRERPVLEQERAAAALPRAEPGRLPLREPGCPAPVRGLVALRQQGIPEPSRQGGLRSGALVLV